MTPTHVKLILDANSGFEHVLRVLRERFGPVPAHRIVMPNPFKSPFLSKFHNIVNIMLNTLRLFRVFLSSGGNNCLTVTTSVLNTIPTLFVRKVLGIRDNVIVLNWYLHNWESNAFVIRILSFLFDRNVVMLLQSPREVELYASLFPTIRAYFVPYCQGEISVAEPDMADEDYIFAGGYTNRDYDTVIECARSLPCNFTIACSHLNRLPTDIPDNVTVHRDIPKETFNRLMSGAKIVVLNLKDQVGSSGQMVALAAMCLGKAIIYADNDGIAYYFQGQDCAVPYAMRNPEDLSAKIRLLMENHRMRADLGDRARRCYLANYNEEARARHLRGIMGHIRI